MSKATEYVSIQLPVAGSTHTHATRAAHGILRPPLRLPPASSFHTPLIKKNASSPKRSLETPAAQRGYHKMHRGIPTPPFPNPLFPIPNAPPKPPSEYPFVPQMIPSPLQPPGLRRRRHKIRSQGAHRRFSVRFFALRIADRVLNTTLTHWRRRRCCRVDVGGYPTAMQSSSTVSNSVREVVPPPCQ